MSAELGRRLPVTPAHPPSCGVSVGSPMHGAWSAETRVTRQTSWENGDPFAQDSVTLASGVLGEALQ